MKIKVIIVPNSRVEKVKQLDLDSYKVWVRAKPIENQANERLIMILSEYFQCQKTKIIILLGHKSKSKVLEVK